MGQHRGFRVVQVGRRWRGDYRVAGAYRSKTYDTRAEALAWARAQAAQLAGGKAPGPAVARTADLSADYLRNLEARRRSPSHLANVRHTLDSLAVAVPNLAADGAHLEVARWLDGLRLVRVGRHQRRRAAAPSAAYRNRVMAEVRAFCRWLLRMDRLVADPSRTLEPATVARRIKPQFSVDEVMRLCALPSPDPRGRWVALMLLAGLRSDEAAALTWGDIRGSVILVRRHAGHRLKRDKERLVPLGPTLAGILGEPGAPGARVAPLAGAHSTVQHGRHFRAFCHAAGVEAGERTPHSCRHTYGAMMIATGAPSILVQAYMGHESVATTADYARAAPLHVDAARGWGMGTLLPINGG